MAEDCTLRKQTVIKAHLLEILSPYYKCKTNFSLCFLLSRPNATVTAFPTVSQAEGCPCHRMACREGHAEPIRSSNYPFPEGLRWFPGSVGRLLSPSRGFLSSPVCCSQCGAQAPAVPNICVSMCFIRKVIIVPPSLLKKELPGFCE